MRISDWSSDVCSSDLFAASEKDRRLAFRAHGASPCSGAAPGSTRARAWNDRIEHYPVVPALSSSLWLRAGGALFEADRQPVVRGAQPAQQEQQEDEQAGELRSEEHTSELQSLMRNSYAVFCLKKKTNTRHKSQ